MHWRVGVGVGTDTDFDFDFAIIGVKKQGAN